MKFTKKALKEFKKDVDRLTKRVVNDLLGTGYTTEELWNHIEDICRYGCISGTVTSLIYYTDTIKFFDTYRKEILYLANEYKDWNSEVCDYVLNLNNIGIVYREGQKRFNIEEKNGLTWFAYELIVNDIVNYFEEY